MEIKFKTNARTVNLLGKDNILDHDSAIFEIVKNAFDAKAKVAKLIINKTQITIADNGDGMSYKIIDEVFFTLGTDYKNETKFDYPVNGSMGIGRLALGRLGNITTVYTSTGIEAHKFIIDWRVFNKKELLENLKFHITSISQIEFKRQMDKVNIDLTVKGSGTIIICSDLLDIWDQSNKESIDLSALESKLSDIKSPFVDDDFHIWFKYDDLETKEIKNTKKINYDAHIKFIFDGVTKNIKYEISYNEINMKNLNPDFINKYVKNNPDLSKYSLDKNKEVKKQYSNEEEVFKDEYLRNLDELLPKTLKKKNIDDIISRIGTFQGDIYFSRKSTVSKSMPKFIEDHGLSYKDRKGIKSGILVYRDSFRIRPYGDTETHGFDWLGIDRTRSINPAGVNRPGYMMQANQLYGFVTFMKDDNLNFEDQANREGIKSSSEFELFKVILLEITRIFSRSRSLLFESYQEYENGNILKEVSNPQVNRIYNSMEYLAKSNDMNITQMKNDSSVQDLVNTNNLLYLYIKARFVQDKNDELITELDLLQALSTQAISMSFFAHEIKNSRKYFSRYNSMLKVIEDKYAELLDKDLSTMKLEWNLPKFRVNSTKQIAYISNFLNVTLKNPKQGKQPKEVLYYYLQGLMKDWESLVESKAYTYTFNVINKNLNQDKLESITGYSTQFDSIFVNLITNSLKAFKKSGQENRLINIIFEESYGDICISYNDNGPGLDFDNEAIQKDPYVIFTPFFTGLSSKRNSGMGLWILSSVVDKLKWKKELNLSHNGFELKMYL